MDELCIIIERAERVWGGVRLNLLYSLWSSISTLYTNLFQQPDWRNFLDIFLMAVVIYEIIRLLLRTRASAVFKGIGVLLIFFWLSDILQLNVVNWMLQQFINTGVIVMVILFQPELRKALEQIGRTSLISPSQLRAQRSADDCVTELVQAMSNMSRKRIGALIIIEQKTGLREFADTGTALDADISAPLIENVFEPNTPLHDGAMIIRNRRILAAACILQLSDDPTISKELGTRHRAALGISETTDAVALIVSEETGIISMAREGKLTRYLDAKALAQILTDLFQAESARSIPARLQHRYAVRKPAPAQKAEDTTGEADRS